MHARSVPYSAGQVVQTLASFRSIQSATHSETFPTMSYAPTSEVQPGVPVGAGPSSSALSTKQGGPSGVPSAAACHSALVRSRFPELRYVQAPARDLHARPPRLAQDGAEHTGVPDGAGMTPPLLKTLSSLRGDLLLH